MIFSTCYICLFFIQHISDIIFNILLILVLVFLITQIEVLFVSYTDHPCMTGPISTNVLLSTYSTTTNPRLLLFKTCYMYEQKGKSTSILHLFQM